MLNKKISVVVPVYNSEKTLVELVTRIINEISKITSDYEIILVDDCSGDSSWQVLKELHKKNNKIKIIHLQKNFGQHNATLCGLNHADGDYIITMDDDLQHPPEEIHKLVEKIQEGYSAVYGKFTIKHHNLLENFFSARFQTLIHYILGFPDTIFISGFLILTRDVVKNMTAIKSSYVLLYALVIRSVPVNKIVNVEVNHSPRKVGKSNYNVRKYLSLSLNLIINYSVLPLFFMGIFGIIVSIISFCYGIFIIGEYVVNPSYGLMGWNSLMVALTFLGGMILFSIAVVGEYLRRILMEVSYGQQYAIGEMEL